MTNTKVLLIGGAPGAGKTTLGRNLAIRLGITSLTIDDLMVAARAVTTAETHPGLHIMTTGDPYGYFTYSTVKKLTTDARIQHEATWPAVERVIASHARSDGSPIVMDGWAMRPAWVTDLKLDNVRSFWFHVEPAVLEAREKANTDFLSHSTDPDRMLENFLGRSYWYNDMIRDAAASLQLPVLKQDGTRTVDDLCDEVLAMVD